MSTMKPEGPWPAILEDTNWNHDLATSRPSYGINDYQRIVKFESEPTEQQLIAFSWFLEQDKCPGWTGVKFFHVTDNTWQFRTTWDSSD